MRAGRSDETKNGTSFSSFSFSSDVTFQVSSRRAFKLHFQTPSGRDYLSCLCGFVATYMLACCPSIKSQHEVRPPCLLQKASDKHTNTLHTHNDPLQMCAVILSHFATFVRNVLLDRHSQHFPLGVNDQEPSSAPPGPGPPCVFCFLFSTPTRRV